MNIKDFQAMKQAGAPIKMITCYDHWSAKILANTNINCILVGDSAAMVMHGHDSTIPADIEMLATHIRAVRSGIGKKFVIGDLPFMSYRKSLSEAMAAVEIFMKAGANSIKLEGVLGNEEIIKHIISSGVPVMGHLGFTPQSINMYGTSYVQGKGESQAKQLMEAAKKLEDLGCFSIVLECIPHLLAEEVTNALSIPTIGIGAGNKTSGQVLVLQDLIGADPSFNPKFLKKYLDISTLIKDAVNSYCSDVDSRVFPDIAHSYSEAKNGNN